MYLELKDDLKRQELIKTVNNLRAKIDLYFYDIDKHCLNTKRCCDCTVRDECDTIYTLDKKLKRTERILRGGAV